MQAPKPQRSPTRSLWFTNPAHMRQAPPRQQLLKLQQDTKLLERSSRTSLQILNYGSQLRIPHPSKKSSSGSDPRRFASLLSQTICQLLLDTAAMPGSQPGHRTTKPDWTGFLACCGRLLSFVKYKTEERMLVQSNRNPRGYVCDRFRSLPPVTRTTPSGHL